MIISTRINIRKDYIMDQTLYDEDIQLVIAPVGDRGGIYIGNLDAARNITTLKKHSISSVITIAKGAFLNHNQQDLPNYMYIPADDDESFNIAAYFDKTYDFIDRNTRRCNLLVHCMAGVSRSVTIVIAFLMKKYHKKMDQAYQQIRSIRPIIDPNSGFLRQLKKYEQSLQAIDHYSPQKTDSPQKAKWKYRRCISEKYKQHPLLKVESTILSELKPSTIMRKEISKDLPKDKILAINLEQKINQLRKKYTEGPLMSKSIMKNLEKNIEKNYSPVKLRNH